MPSSWFGRKDSSDVDGPQGSSPARADKPPMAPEPGGEFQQLADHLGKLEGLLLKANERVAGYLMWRESQTVEADQAIATSLEAGISALAEKLDQLEARLKSPTEASPSGSPTEKGSDASSSEILAALNQQSTVLQDLVEGLGRQMENGFQRLGDLVRPEEEPQQQTFLSQESAAWERAILGPDLAGHAHLAFKRREFLQGVLEGDSAARALAGQLLVFQSAPAERLPPLLKEIGEAYYRWQPKTTPGANPLEEALVQWLRMTCEAAGISNTIELVHPGERFDAARHNATSRGVEITEVRGWIVLRDNGKVYTKASVAVR